MIEKIGDIPFDGKVKKDKDISAIVCCGSFLFLGSDEAKRKIQVLQKQEKIAEEARVYEVYEVNDELEITLPTLAENDEQEIDIEGMSISNGNTIFVVGSHSLKRTKVKDDKSYQENQQRIQEVVLEDKKNQIFKLTFDPQTGKHNPNIEKMRIKRLLENDSILGRFTAIPSKENGVDIEGIASDGDTLYLGFRGPVLRENYVPVMVIKNFTRQESENLLSQILEYWQVWRNQYTEVTNYELRFINLGGKGIRDITKVQEGFLIIAGPVGDGVGSYQLYFWDGVDDLPGDDRLQKAKIICLGEIPLPQNEAKAEGICVLEETFEDYQAIIVYDGVPNGGATLYKIAKIPSVTEKLEASVG